ncbi:MAG TPA: hypothetical protein VF438_00100 [Candidatus Paceibacterota bacterium]
MQDYLVIQAKREVGIQALYALRASQNIYVKSEKDKPFVMSSVHSLLTHCANISKLLWSPLPRKGNKNIKSILGVDLAEALGIKETDFPLIRSRIFRDSLDHFDERLVEWIEKAFPTTPGKPQISVTDLVVGRAVSGPNMMNVRHYDPDTHVFTFMDDQLNLEDLKNELLKIQEIVGGPIIIED